MTKQEVILFLEKNYWYRIEDSFYFDTIDKELNDDGEIISVGDEYVIHVNNNYALHVTYNYYDQLKEMRNSEIIQLKDFKQWYKSNY